MEHQSKRQKLDHNAFTAEFLVIVLEYFSFAELLVASEVCQFWKSYIREHTYQWCKMLFLRDVTLFGCPVELEKEYKTFQLFELFRRNRLDETEYVSLRKEYFRFETLVANASQYLVPKASRIDMGPFELDTVIDTVYCVSFIIRTERIDPHDRIADGDCAVAWGPFEILESFFSVELKMEINLNILGTPLNVRKFYNKGIPVEYWEKFYNSSALEGRFYIEFLEEPTDGYIVYLKKAVEFFQFFVNEIDPLTVYYNSNAYVMHFHSQGVNLRRSSARLFNIVDALSHTKSLHKYLEVFVSLFKWNGFVKLFMFYYVGGLSNSDLEYLFQDYVETLPCANGSFSQLWLVLNGLKLKREAEFTTELPSENDGILQ